ncbi:hypothetical protein ONV78_04970 [Hahella sp. CR1]|uniref:YEATS-associated helix-containing protein n=1 Tax=Hahella sp. CR1 TaxID=2992807 RepID=UPI00244351DE|nr:YEATS-associated helix-containing protein [Hahella sp. CR1]MDG9667080.1 hypothetical protein [Hahella sp. CR1]
MLKFQISYTGKRRTLVIFVTTLAILIVLSIPIVNMLYFSDVDFTPTINKDIPLKIYILICIAISSGLLGGLTNYCLQRKSGDQKDNDVEISDLISCLITGVSASLIIPLFLHIIGSNIIKDAINTNPLNYLVYMGFCLIAAISSRRFLSSVTQRIIKTVEEAEKAAENAEKIALDNQKKYMELKQKDEEFQKYIKAENYSNTAKFHFHNARDKTVQTTSIENEIARAKSCLDKSIGILNNARAWSIKGNVLSLESKIYPERKELLLREAIQACENALKSPYLDNEREAHCLVNIICYKILLNKDEPLENLKPYIEKACNTFSKVLSIVEKDNDIKSYSYYDNLIAFSKSLLKP